MTPETYYSFFDFFTDPILRGPTLGSLLMCLSSAMVGVIVFLRKESLLGESLSHSAYPGVVIGLLIAGILGFNDTHETELAILVLGSAFLSSLVGLFLILQLEKRLKVASDAALCFILSAFFGLGITLASHIQFAYSTLYLQIQVYLYGQAASMTDLHVFIYAILACMIISTVCLLYKELQVMTFDQGYAKCLGISTSMINMIVCLLIVLAIIVGIRSVGVVLMSAMLIAPAVAARQYTQKMHTLFFLAALFGSLSGLLGTIFSVHFTEILSSLYPNLRLSLPTGPMIVVVASSICIFSLFFAPERGLVLRIIRAQFFRYRCLCENLLKTIWKISPNHEVSLQQIAKYQPYSTIYLKLVLSRLVWQGWLKRTDSNKYTLTPDGCKWAERIVRLHRLWEVYLVHYIGVGKEKVHKNAEEMEHIITPDLEQELMLLLKNPSKDPHQQPIPPRA